MTSSPVEDQPGLLDHVLVPVANEEDARQTARTLAPYEPAHVTVLHVIEKGEGVPDKKPLIQSEELAEATFAAFKESFPAANTRKAYERDIVGAIFDAAEKVEASAIAYRSRGGGRLVQFLSGDLSLKLVTQANRPVIALPRKEADS